MWNQLPERFGKWNSIYRFHLRWAKRGVFYCLFKTLAEAKNKNPLKVIDATYIKAHQDATRHKKPPETRGFGKTKGGRNSGLNACVNGNGKPLDILLFPGNHHEINYAGEVLGDVYNKFVLADRGLDCDLLREYILSEGGVAIIPGKKNRKKAVFYIPEIGRQRRVVENFFARIKRHKRIHTRYDMLCETYISFVSLAFLADWVRF